MELVDEIFPLVEGFYVDLHRNPELSHQEYRTARAVAEWLSRAGYDVATGVGGTGVVGVLRNGDGPTVLLRGDMDALPVEEKTGLPYASTARGTDDEGNDVPIMHACGHDVHTACLVGVADLLASTRQHWQGTLMIVAQPAEEAVDGARSMIEDGLYERFGRPDIALGQHVSTPPAGMVVHRAGTILASSATFKVRVFGTGGHGSQPHTAVDPVLLAANIVTRLQTIVAREINPTDMAVVTVGKLRAGSKANIIPDEAYLEINTRAFDDVVAGKVHGAIERIVRAEAEASGAPRAPEITHVREAGLTENDQAQTPALAAAHRAYFGAPYVIDLPAPLTGSEDFGEFGLPADPLPIPYVYWFVGATPHKMWDEAPGETPFEKLAGVPSNHSPFFAPDREPTLRAGLAALTIGALSYLGRSTPLVADDFSATAVPPPVAEDIAPAAPTPSDAPLPSDAGLLLEPESVEARMSAEDGAAVRDPEEVEPDRVAQEHPQAEQDEAETGVDSTQYADMSELLEDPPPPQEGPTQGTDTGPSQPLNHIPPPPPSGQPYAAPPPQGPPVTAPPPEDPPYRL